ncbi:D-alanyl-D-alanine carboxypeptidase [Candidatus Uhrbacteria bacterium]|nr:D-alanyl-D-alanine carboxypeptidase [Candidatus Uhrbacteria bacterium]
MGIKEFFICFLMSTAAVFPAAVFAQEVSPRDALTLIYQSRPDLQRAFDAQTGLAIAGTNAGFLLDLEDWATQYGWMEHPELKIYAPTQGDGVPVRTSAEEIESSIQAQAYLVMDRSTGKILTVKNENKVWPIASLTKLMTASVVLDHDVLLNKTASVLNTDNVGGARLYVNDGDEFTVEDLFYATLVGSANNAANALARTTGLSRAEFVQEMNARAKVLNLVRTQYVDPTGIELGNVSTAREMARVAQMAFSQDSLQRFTTTATKYISDLSQGTTKKMTNTNWMLWKPEYDDLYVTGGKTGYLIESGWNLVVSLRPMEGDADKELLIVLFGADSRGDSFINADRLATWAWETHEWQKVQ